MGALENHHIIPQEVFGVGTGEAHQLILDLQAAGLQIDINDPAMNIMALPSGAHDVDFHPEVTRVGA